MLATLWAGGMIGLQEKFKGKAPGAGLARLMSRLS